MAVVVAQTGRAGSRRGPGSEETDARPADAVTEPTADELLRAFAPADSAPYDGAEPFPGVARPPVVERAEYGPLRGAIDDLLDRAAVLTDGEIEALGTLSGRQCRGRLYAESLLALRRAADRSGRAAAVGHAGNAAETLVVRIAAMRCQAPEERARWNVVSEQAAWGAGDAARALVVSDILPEPHLRTLTRAWETLARRR